MRGACVAWQPRTTFGLARTGSFGADPSGDYGNAFSTVRKRGQTASWRALRGPTAPMRLPLRSRCPRRQVLTCQHPPAANAGSHAGSIGLRRTRERRDDAPVSDPHASSPNGNSHAEAGPSRSDTASPALLLYSRSRYGYRPMRFGVQLSPLVELQYCVEFSRHVAEPADEVRSFGGEIVLLTGIRLQVE
jgi:hypothetical protein